MKKKYSGDLGMYIIVGIFAPLSFILLWIYAGQKFTPTIIIPIVVYVVFCARYIRFFEFKEDYYEVLFPIRIIKRRQKIYYSNIEYAEYYLKKANQGLPPLHFSIFDRRGYFYRLKYELSGTYKNIIPLLYFLKSKGIKIKIVDDKYNKEYADLLEPEENQQKVRYYR